MILEMSSTKAMELRLKYSFAFSDNLENRIF